MARRQEGRNRRDRGIHTGYPPWRGGVTERMAQDSRSRRCCPATVLWLVRSRSNQSGLLAPRHEGCSKASGESGFGNTEEGTLRDGGASCHVAIIGAGPYGLAAAAHLRAEHVEARIFGEPMEFWKRHMPRGMFLRSSPSASNLADPDGRLRLDRYHALHGLPHTKPTPLEDFVRYGQWFQQQAVPDVDRRTVTYLAADVQGFRVRLEDGEEFPARRVVVATGISPFARRPVEFAGLPAPLVSHSFDHADLSRFAGQRVVVVGAGQSALESAALLHEAGAQVEVVARASRLVWNGIPLDPDRPLPQRLREPEAGLGSGWSTWFYSRHPGLFRHLPERIRNYRARTALGPAGASWLRGRVESQFPVLLGHAIGSAATTPPAG